MRLGDTRFFNLFALLASGGNPGRADSWQTGDVRWTRERISRRGPGLAFQIEIHTLQHDGRRGWTLLAAHETWRDPNRADAFRNGRWIHLSRGNRADVLAWFSAQEAALDRKA
jgi:hypothetical protein